MPIDVAGGKRCAGFLSRVASRRLRAENIDPDPILARAGLDPRQVAEASASISVSRQVEFVALAAQALGDPLLGFRLASTFEFRTLGWLYYAAASAERLGDALTRLARYSHISNEGLRLDIGRREHVCVQMRYIGVPRYTDFHQIGAFVGLVIFLSRHLTAMPLAPTVVSIAHPVGSHKRELEQILRCSVVEGIGPDEIRFPPDVWNAEVIRSDSYLQQLCVTACEEALARLNVPALNLQVAIENHIAELLPHGEMNHRHIADKLGMSSRTLLRRLAAQHCSFSDLVRKVRLALARHYLNGVGLSVSETAWLLGYADVSAFTRAFRRWTGSPPSAARSKGRQSIGVNAQVRIGAW
jgi:AraC-like DNA-binding protein